MTSKTRAQRPPRGVGRLLSRYREGEPDGHAIEVTNLCLREPGKPGTALLVSASLLLLALAAAQGYVSWRAQYGFVLAAKHVHLASVLEALGLDTAAAIFALLALARARLGNRAVTERGLNMACAVGSLLMNVLAADLGSPRSVAIYALPSALYAASSDRLIAVVRDHAKVAEEARAAGSVWRAAALALLWGTRLAVAPRSTLAGGRRWVLTQTPVPPAPKLVIPQVQAAVAELEASRSDATRAIEAARAEAAGLVAEAERAAEERARAAAAERDQAVADAKAAEGRALRTAEQARAGMAEIRSAYDDRAQALTARAEFAEGELERARSVPARDSAGITAREGSKKAELLRLYDALRFKDSRYGDRASAASVAAELAPRIDLNPGTARTYLYDYLDAGMPAVTPGATPGADPAGDPGPRLVRPGWNGEVA